MTKDDIVAAAVALDLPERLIACHLPALQRLAEEAGRRARIAHAQEVRTDLTRIEKWRGLALSRDGDGRTVEAIREEAMQEERQACLRIVWAPHFKPVVRNELGKRAKQIEERGSAV